MPTPNPNTKVKHVYPGDVARRGETRTDTQTSAATLHGYELRGKE